MEIGEPICVAPPTAPPDDVELAAELVSVNFISSLKTSHAKATIKGPHWQAGQDRKITDDWKKMAKKLGLPAEPYSKRAAVYRVNSAGGKYDVEIKVKITKSKNVTGDAKLVGNLRGLVIEGPCPTSVGEHTIAATFTDPPEEIRAYRGKISWLLDAATAGITVSLGPSLAEIYFTLGEPTTPFQDVGVWTEVLRFLDGKINVAGKKDKGVVAASITEYCHGSHGLRYDTEGGTAKYGTHPGVGTFELEGYLVRSSAACNCYDQASAIQVLAGALGINVSWCFIDPFGFITPTQLVGVSGSCNNPFFDHDESNKLVPWDSHIREPFSNHAFARTETNKVLDACAGPHLGTETATQYVAASIDSRPDLYRGRMRRDGRRFRPGNVGDISVEPEVCKVR